MVDWMSSTLGAVSEVIVAVGLYTFVHRGRLRFQWDVRNHRVAASRAQIRRQPGDRLHIQLAEGRAMSMEEAVVYARRNAVSQIAQDQHLKSSPWSRPNRRHVHAALSGWVRYLNQVCSSL
jgi:hypothetical protein